MKATITFHDLIQETQHVAASDPNREHMVARAWFTLDIGGKQYRNMSATLRQPFGTAYADEPIEVEKPSGPYKGNWDHNAFREIVEDYYRGLIGNQGKVMRIAPGGQDIQMQNIKMTGFSKTYTMEVPD
jgi:isocitrate dehydrogenase